MYICNALFHHGYSSFTLTIYEYINTPQLTKVPGSHPPLAFLYYIRARALGFIYVYILKLQRPGPQKQKKLILALEQFYLNIYIYNIIYLKLQNLV
jgi:hypothetical protein